MRLLIVAFLATACAFTTVAAAQTAGPTGSPGAPDVQVKTPPAKAHTARRVSKKRVADCGKAAPAKAVTTRAGTARTPAPTKA